MNTLTKRELDNLSFTPLEPELETLDLVRYWRAINRNKWRILALVVAVGLLATIAAFNLRPVYRATATVMVEGTKTKAVSQEELYQYWYAGATRDYFLTQFEIMKSREMAERLVKVMGLARHPEFDPRRPPAAPWYAQWLPAALVPPAKPVQMTDAEAEEIVTARVMGQTTVQPIRNTHLVKLSFDSFDPEIAARIPNALAMIYIVSDLEAKTEQTRRATAFLAKQSEELRQKVLESERALQQYRDREKIVEAKGISLAGATRQLEELTSSLVDARRKRLDAEALYNQVTAARQGKSPDALETLPAVLRHPLVQRFKEAEADAERRLGEASKRYGPEHPRMVAAQSDLRAAQENLRRQINAVVQGVQRDYDVARANEAAIERALAQSKDEIQSRNRKEFQLHALEREVAANRQIYDTFMQRSKETTAGDIKSPVARVIDPALPPKGPFGPNKRLIVGLSLLGALLAGVSLALLIERLKNTVKSSHEVESTLFVRSLGVVPHTEPENNVLLERMYSEANQNAFAEAIRTLRSSILLTGVHSTKNVVLLTSSIPEEGKTTVACNLGYALSMVKKTLLLEADMRRPGLKRVLGEVAKQPGLAELLAGEATIEECLYEDPDTGLVMVHAGKTPPNPLDLISSPRLAEVIDKLKESFDVIVIDSPPVQLVSDALVLAQIATTVLFVVKSDSTPYPVARHALGRLQRADVEVLGAVLNQIDIEKADKYYGEFSGYGNKYYRKYGYYRTPA
jgi:capsular exopolysaccharide synthesis family protein